jgi:hypothetical protein
VSGSIRPRSFGFNAPENVLAVGLEHLAKVAFWQRQGGDAGRGVLIIGLFGLLPAWNKRKKLYILQ